MWFVDLASFQAGSSVAALHQAGSDRLAVKLTEGLTYIDPYSDAPGEWYDQAGHLGMARMPYHFGHAANSGVDEADFFLRVIGTAGGWDSRVWWVLDTEDTTATGRAAAHAAEFCGRMVERGHPNGIIYSGGWYLNPAHLAAADVPPSCRNLWISDYSPMNDTQIPVPNGWVRSQIVARQYTAGATVNGVPGLVDVSRVLRDWLTVSAAPTTTTTTTGDFTTMFQTEAELSAFLIHTVRRALNISDAGPAVPQGQTNLDGVYANLLGNSQAIMRALGTVVTAETAETATDAAIESRLVDLWRAVAAVAAGKTPTPPAWVPTTTSKP